MADQPVATQYSFGYNPSNGEVKMAFLVAGTWKPLDKVPVEVANVISNAALGKTNSIVVYTDDSGNVTGINCNCQVGGGT